MESTKPLKIGYSLNFLMILHQSGSISCIESCDTYTLPRFCIPQIPDHDQAQTSNISEHPRRVSSHARARPVLTTWPKEINLKMSSLIPEASHWTITARYENATPRRCLPQIRSRRWWSTHHNLALASPRPTNSPRAQNMECTLQRPTYDSLHRRLRLPSR
jgi:hypothetical protein